MQLNTTSPSDSATKQKQATETLPKEERKQFMQRKSILFYKAHLTNVSIFTATAEDPMRKREQFAVSLRKQKTKDIIAHKRRRMLKTLVERSVSGTMSSPLNADISMPEY